VSATDDLLNNNEGYAEGFAAGDLDAPPATKVAVVTCMDARIDVHKILGLDLGDAHVIRNAGGAVTDDAIRSLAISQRLLGTEEVVLIQHTRCGMRNLDENDFKNALENDAGVRPDWAVEAFEDLEENIRRSIERVRSSPFLPHAERVRGFVYEVESGRLREVA
jgi:carbonic anhydrase